VELRGTIYGHRYTTLTNINGYFLVQNVELDDYEVWATDKLVPPRYWGNREDSDPENDTVLALKTAVDLLNQLFGQNNYELLDTPIHIVVSKYQTDYASGLDKTDFTALADDYTRSVRASFGDASLAGLSDTIYDQNFTSDLMAAIKAEEIVRRSEENTIAYHLVALGNPHLKPGQVIGIESTSTGISGKFRVAKLERMLEPRTGKWLDRIRSIPLESFEELDKQFVRRREWQDKQLDDLGRFRVLDRRTKELAGLGRFVDQLPGGKDH